MPSVKPFKKPTYFRSQHKDRAVHLDHIALAERYEQIHSNPDLSPVGKAKQWAQAAAELYKRHRGTETAQLKALAQLEAEGEARMGRAFSVSGDMIQREMDQKIFDRAASDPAVRTQLWRELTDGNRNDARTVRLRKMALALDPILTGLSDAHLNLIRLRLDPELPNEVRDLQVKALELDRELADTRALLTAIRESVRREDFEQLGVVGKPIGQWTAEERARYAEQVGMDRFREELYADLLFATELSGPVPANHLVDSEGRAAAANAAEQHPDLKDFFVPQPSDDKAVSA